jgi:adenosylcobinamide-GDP ribazoletransferase
MRSFLVALAFLTVVPVRFRTPPTAECVARSRWWYPVVGLLLGAALGGWAAVLAWLPGSAAVRAFLALLAWVGVTGALHVDGFCDCCDGLFGGGKPEDRLRIMKDPHVGSFGLVGGVLVLLGKFAGLQAALGTWRGPWVVGGTVLVARCLVLCVAAGARYPRPEGTGKVLIEATQAREGWLFAAAGAVAAVLVLGLVGLAWLRAAAVCAMTGVVVLGIRRLCVRRLGGITGDCLGAAIELAELSFLLASAACGV